MDSTSNKYPGQSEIEAMMDKSVKTAMTVFWQRVTESIPKNPKLNRCRIENLEKLADILHETIAQTEGSVGIRGFVNAKDFAETLDYTIGRLRIVDQIIENFWELTGEEPLDRM